MLPVRKPLPPNAHGPTVGGKPWVSYVPVVLILGFGVMLSVVAFTVTRNWEYQKIEAEFLLVA